MTCDEARQRMVDRWSTGIDEAERIELDRHQEQCAACREEAAELEGLWNGMGALPVEEPSKNMRDGFYHMMEAYRLASASRPVAAPVAMPKPHANPWWLAAAAGVILVFGLSIGHFYTARMHDQQTISQLNGEIQNMRQLVTLSLLQQQSASDRLRGVSYSVRMEPADEQVTSALLQTLNHDSNVNVRLAAVDALRPLATHVSVRKGLREAIAAQDSPLVQIALIDWVVESKDRGSLSMLEKLEQQKDLHPAVRPRLASAIARLRMQ